MEEAFVAEFGPRLVELGCAIWVTQARALERAPYVGSNCSGVRYLWERGFAAGELQSVQELLRTREVGEVIEEQPRSRT